MPPRDDAARGPVKIFVKEFKIQTEILLPRPREEVFAFFAAAHNLQAITPPWARTAG